MLETQGNFLFADHRIIIVTAHLRIATKSNLDFIYYRYSNYAKNGFRNFFNLHSDKMTCTEARKFLEWDNIYFNRTKILTLHFFPSHPLLNCFGSSEEEREKVFRNIIRETVERLMTEAKLSLNWVAAVDVNSYEPRGIVVMHKMIFDAKKSKFKVLKHCFPKSFLVHDEPRAKTLNFMEKTFTEIFFDRAAQGEDFENRIDDLILISRKYKVKLPLSYYAFRYLDSKGNLITECEKRSGKYE